MKYKLNAYDLELIDILKSKHKLWSTKIADAFAQDIPEVYRMRVLADAILKLEETKDMYLAELTEYKIHFGELREY